MKAKGLYAYLIAVLFCFALIAVSGYSVFSAAGYGSKGRKGSSGSPYVETYTYDFSGSNTGTNGDISIGFGNEKQELATSAADSDQTATDTDIVDFNINGITDSPNSAGATSSATIGRNDGTIFASGSHQRRASVLSYVKVVFGGDIKTAITNGRVNSLAVSAVGSYACSGSSGDNSSKTQNNIFMRGYLSASWTIPVLDTAARDVGTGYKTSGNDSGVAGRTRSESNNLSWANPNISLVNLNNNNYTYYVFAKATTYSWDYQRDPLAAASVTITNVTFTVTYNTPKVTFTCSAGGAVSYTGVMPAKNPATAAEVTALAASTVNSWDNGYYFRLWWGPYDGVWERPLTYSKPLWQYTVNEVEVGAYFEAFPAATGGASFIYNAANQGPEVPDITADGGWYSQISSRAYQGTGSTTYGPSASKPVNAGTYKLTCISQAQNVETPFDNGSYVVDFTISPRDLRVTPTTRSKIYGDPEPVWNVKNTAYTWTGGDLVGGQTPGVYRRADKGNRRECGDLRYKQGPFSSCQ